MIEIEKIDKAIEKMVSRSLEEQRDGAEAMRFSQAAVNLANAKACLVQTRLNEARRLERERVLAIFASLAEQMDTKADEDDGDIGLVWTAAAACVRRVCDEVKSA